MKRDLLKLPDDFEANLRALLKTPPAPHDTPGSRKATPEPPPAPPKPEKKAKPKARKGYRRTNAEASAHREAQARGISYEYERAAVRRPGQQPKRKPKSK